MGLEWNVFLEDFNARKIVKYNVFRHTSFVRDCAKALAECGKNREAFEERLNRELHYYFWSKCEYEIILSDWPPRDDFEAEKVDVYDQIHLNWPIFTEYVWTNRGELERSANNGRR